MKTKLLITILGLMPVLAMAEVTVNQTPRGGESVTFTPSSSSGRTASGDTYKRETTAPGVSTLEVQGANGGSLSKTSTAPGVSTLEVEGANGNSLSRTSTAPGRSQTVIQGQNGNTVVKNLGEKDIQITGQNGNTVIRDSGGGSTFTQVEGQNNVIVRTKSTDGQKSTTVYSGSDSITLNRGGSQPNNVLVEKPGSVTEYTASKSTTSTGQTDVTVTKSNYPTGTVEGQKTFVIATPPQPAN
jgi:hypothetical protein